MKLYEAMNEATVCQDDPYELSGDRYIIRLYRRDLSGITFFVAHKVDDNWKTGQIWLGYGVSIGTVSNIIDTYAQRPLSFLSQISNNADQNWTDWELYTAQEITSLLQGELERRFRP